MKNPDFKLAVPCGRCGSEIRSLAFTVKPHNRITITASCENCSHSIVFHLSILRLLDISWNLEQGEAPPEALWSNRGRSH